MTQTTEEPGAGGKTSFKILNTGMDLQHLLFELEEKGKYIYKKRELLKTPPVRRCQLYKTPP
jgi:hypothetical protein